MYDLPMTHLRKLTTISHRPVDIVHLESHDQESGGCHYTRLACRRNTIPIYLRGQLENTRNIRLGHNSRSLYFPQQSQNLTGRYNDSEDKIPS